MKRAFCVIAKLFLNDNNEIKLVGESWTPDLSDWKTSKTLLKDIVSDTSFPDQFSSLKNFIDKTIEINSLAKDVAIHNFCAGSGVLNKPLVYLVWPSPNSGYRSIHMLKIWEEVRLKCWLEEDGSFRKNPVNLIGHASDSGAFQHASAISLMSPIESTLAAGVKYLTLGIGESQIAVPYFGPLPSIAYLDYDDGICLFLRCLKYQTLELNLAPMSKSTFVASIDHLKELKIYCDESGYSCSFSNNDLLFASFLDQNCDAALKIFTKDVAKLLQENVVGSNGTALYIHAVVSLFDPFLNPSSNPNEMQKSLAKGITIFRLWKKLLEFHKKRLNAAPGATNDHNKRGFFLTHGLPKEEREISEYFGKNNRNINTDDTDKEEKIDDEEEEIVEKNLKFHKIAIKD